jgi:ribonuclease HII
MPTFRIEMSLGGRVAGIDEAGRGPLAGPVVAAAVVIEPKRLPRSLIRRIDDSKQMQRDAREEVFEKLMTFANDGFWFGIASATVEEIDSINILQATFAAMTRALDGMAAVLGCVPDAALIDGNRAPKNMPCKVQTVIDGDAKCVSIAAASILAKVTRDRQMIELARDFPGYGWATNVGYGTPEHLDGLARLGPTIHHRRSFAPIAQLSLPLTVAVDEVV